MSIISNANGLEFFRCYLIVIGNGKRIIYFLKIFSLAELHVKKLKILSIFFLNICFKYFAANVAFIFATKDFAVIDF